MTYYYGLSRGVGMSVVNPRFIQVDERQKIIFFTRNNYHRKLLYYRSNTESFTVSRCKKNSFENNYPNSNTNGYIIIKYVLWNVEGSKIIVQPRVQKYIPFIIISPKYLHNNIKLHVQVYTAHFCLMQAGYQLFQKFNLVYFYLIKKEYLFKFNKECKCNVLFETIGKTQGIMINNFFFWYSNVCFI